FRGGAAEGAGLKPGDRIVSFNGVDNPKWDTIRGDVLLSPGRPLPLTVERDGQRINLNLTPSSQTEDGETAGYPDFIPDYGSVPVIVREVEPNTPAAEAGLQPRDRILAVAGQSVHSAEQVTQFIRDHKNQPITLTVDRNGQRVEITATARSLPPDGRERLGFRPDEEIPLQKVEVVAAASYAVDTNLEILRLTGKAIGQVFTGQRSARNTLSGPIGIYNAASNAVEKLGWSGLFAMLGFLSLNLGIFNLLPIPVLDGGAIFLLLIEGALATIGLKLSLAVKERIQQVGFVVVILLMVFVITNDVIKTVSRTPDSKPAATAPAK
ncbi:MAG: site-2 protease family protein, partial [Pyrinomonadaceae bacterium]